MTEASSSPTRSSPTRTALWAFSRGVPYGEVPDWVTESLRASFPQLRVIVSSDGETILREIAEAEIFISWALKPEQFAAAKQLRWIHSPAAGVTQLLFQPWLSIAPGIAIFIVVFAFNMVGDGLRDVLDPRTTE